eukprot:6963296-Prymnesium_polylepis.1
MARPWARRPPNRNCAPGRCTALVHDVKVAALSNCGPAFRASDACRRVGRGVDRALQSKGMLHVLRVGPPRKAARRCSDGAAKLITKSYSDLLLGRLDLVRPGQQRALLLGRTLVHLARLWVALHRYTYGLSHVAATPGVPKPFSTRAGGLQPILAS